MQKSNRGLVRFYQILIVLQVLLIVSGCWLIAETGRWLGNLVCIALNLGFLVWNWTILKDIKNKG